MKRKLLKTWGILLTAGMLMGSNGSVVANAAEAVDGQVESNTYYSEQETAEAETEASESQETGTDSDASKGAESGTDSAASEEDNEGSLESEESKSKESEEESSESQETESSDTEEESTDSEESGESESEESGEESSESQETESSDTEEESTDSEESGESESEESEEESSESEESNSSETEEESKSEESEEEGSESQGTDSSESGEDDKVQGGSSTGPEATGKPAEGSEGQKPGTVPGETAEPDSEEAFNGWKEEDGKYYWYEDGVKQGLEEGGKEVYDPETENWYWLDNADNGARAAGREVYLETDGGKWVRYDEEGRRVKGEYILDGQAYYYEPVTGAQVKGPMVLSDGRKVFYDLETGQMIKGEQEINGAVWLFDETDGHLIEEIESKFWLTIDEHSYWYVDWVRQGWKPEEPEYLGEELYDEAAAEWVWLDGTEQGRLAVNKLVYLENGQADAAGNLGKWVFYDENGHMFKGWTEDGLYYYDPVYGTMARGTVVIVNKEYEFDSETGVKLSEKVISGFEAFGIESNVEAGTEYEYTTNCYDVGGLRTVGKAVFDYNTFESDETHAAREGYEWKQVKVSMKFDSKSALYFGYRYAVLYGLDYYAFNNASVETAEDDSIERGNVIHFEGKEYDISTHYEVLEEGWREDGSGYVTLLYECQVPVGYDGMTFALYNASNVGKGDLALDRLDENSLIFRMQ